MLTKGTKAIPTKIVLIIGVLLLGIGLILHIVAMATHNWMSFSGWLKVTFGLFKICTESVCVMYNDYARTESSLATVQFLTITGLLLAFLAFFQSIIFSFIVYKGLTKCKPLPIFAGVFALIAAFLNFVGSIVFAVGVYGSDTMGWDMYPELGLSSSFFLCIVASGLLGFGGILVWIGGHRIIASAAPQPEPDITPDGLPMCVVYQASGSGAVYAPNYQPTESSAMQQNALATYPPPQISPQQHLVYPPQQYAAYPAQQYAAYPAPYYAAYPPQQYAVYPPQYFPATGSEEKNTTAV